MADLNPKHLLLIDFLADPADQRTMAEKSEAAGFHETYVWELLRKPEFLQVLHKRTTELVASHRAKIYNYLLRDAGKGDTQAGIAYLKACGDITGGTNVVTNVTQSNANNEDFADRLRDRFSERRLASERCKPVPTDDD